MAYKKAKHPVKCEKGGKHSPTTKEDKVDGQHIKRSVCDKCGKVV